MTTPDAASGAADGSAEVLRLAGPHELVHAIPYLVGFPPRRSVVVVALSGRRGRVLMTARVDLAGDPVTALRPAWPAARREGATAVVLSIHDDVVAAGPLPWRDLAEELQSSARSCGLDVLDALCVGAGRFWSYRCVEPSCCPAEGRAVQPKGLVAAELVLRGRQLVADRQELVAELASDPARVAGVTRWVDRLPHPAGWPMARRAAGVDLLDGLLEAPDGAETDDVVTAGALVALADLWVRDSQFLRRGDPGDERAARLWWELARAAPPGLRAAPLVLLAACSYRSGDGARANVALEAATAEVPDYPLAVLMGEALSVAVPPEVVTSWLDRAAREVRGRLRGEDDGFR